MVNGLEIPSISWDADSLAETTTTLSGLGLGLPDALKGLLPLTSQLGIGAIVKFPLAAGQAALPLTADSAGATDAKAAADSFLAQVGSPAKINIPVVYEATGDWSVAGMTADQWSSVVAAVPWGSLKLTSEQIGTLSKAGVVQMDITTDSAGIHIAVNGKALPFVNWGDGKLNNVIKLAGQAGALSSLPVPADQLDGLVQQLLPMLTTTNVSLHVTFPK